MQCTTIQRPSLDISSPTIDSSIGRSPKTSLSLLGSSPTSCHHTRWPYSAPAGKRVYANASPPCAHRTVVQRVSGIVSVKSWPDATSMMRSVDRSSPPIDTPNATRAPSNEGQYQSSAAVLSSRRAAGSIKVSGFAAGSTAERTISRNCASPPAALEREHRRSGDHAARRDRGAEQLDEARVQRRATRQGLEDAAGPPVLGVDPLQRLVRGGVFEPAERVGHFVAVEHIDGVAPRSGRRRIEERQVSLGRSWASCRGSPCSAACAPCASWSSST